MSITPSSLFPPQPSTVRAQSLRLSYDSKNDRIVYPQGKSVFVRSVDPINQKSSLQFSKHIHPVTCATFAPNGNYVASGDEAGNVKIWDSSINAERGIFEQPNIKSEFQVLSGPIKSIAWDADGQRVIAVGQGKDKFGHCFTWDSGNSIGEIQGHSDTINAVDIKPQRPYRAATVGVDKALVFYQGPPFKFDKSVRGHHTNTVRDVKFSPDGKYLVSVGSDRVIVVYDGKTGEYIKKLENAHNGGIFGISWYKDSQFATCSADNTVKLWDVELLESIGNGFHVSSSGAVTVENQQVGLITTAKFIISLSNNGNFNYFEYEQSEPTPAFVIGGVQNPITALSAVHNDKLLVGSSDGTLVEVGIEGTSFVSKPTVFVGGHTNYLSSVVATSGFTLTAGWDDTAKLWKNDELISSTTLPSQPKKILAVTPKVFAILFELKLEAYAITESQGLEKLAELDLLFPSSDISSFKDTIYVTNLKENRIEVFSLKDDFVFEKSYPSLRASPTLVRISPNGEFAAVADSFGKYTLYKNSDQSVVTTRWAFHSSKVLDAQWTPDSKFIISGGLDTGILMYSVGRPAKVLKSLLAHQTGVSGLTWLSYEEEKKLASFISTGLDGVIKSWVVDLSVY